MKLRLFALLLALFLCACNSESQRSIVVLYDNDVHCAIDGYGAMASLRDQVSDTADVFVVSSGDFLQGSAACAATEGESIVRVMNAVGYDVVTIGNHELDYMPPRLFELSKKLNTEITNVNFTRANSTTPIFKPFVLKTAGSKKIAFVGVLTPDAVRSESYAFYDSLGNMTYDVHERDIHAVAQNAVNEARNAGADYVVVLSHLGESPSGEGDVSSVSLIRNTVGVDAVLDGHMHSVIAEQWVKNAEGWNVLLTQTGEKFNNVGLLSIGRNGALASRLVAVKDIQLTDQKVLTTVDTIKAELSGILGQIVSSTEFDLNISENGKRVIRNAECNMGDLVADAFRYETGAQIGLVNGGGVRSGITAGEITYQQVMDASPFENDLDKIEATGSQIVDALNEGLKNYPEESGGFLQVSGLRYSIAVPKNAKAQALNVEVENADGSYSPIGLDKAYTVGLSSYVVKKGGEVTAFRNSRMLQEKISTDTEALAKYFKSFGGKVPEKYRKAQSRL